MRYSLSFQFSSVDYNFFPISETGRSGCDLERRAAGPPDDNTPRPRDTRFHPNGVLVLSVKACVARYSPHACPALTDCTHKEAACTHCPLPSLLLTTITETPVSYTECNAMPPQGLTARLHATRTSLTACLSESLRTALWCEGHFRTSAHNAKA